MLTDNGKTCLIRYLAKYGQDIATHIAIGAGATTESANDTSLALQFYMSPITATSVDQVSKKIFYRAVIPTDISGSIYELGVVCRTNASDTGARTTTLFDFDLETEYWSAGAAGTNGRSGPTLLLSSSSGASDTSTLEQLAINLAQTNGDLKVRAGIYSNGNTLSVKIRFGDANGNYVEKTFSSIVSGYQIIEAPLNSFSKIGIVDMENISFCQITSTAKTAVTATTEFDIIITERNESFPDGDILISRKVLSSPRVKIAAEELEIQYELDII